MGRAERNNPVAAAAKNGELPPKEKTLSKRERDRQTQTLIKALICREMIRPGSIKKELKKERRCDGEDGKGGKDA